jgi:hypothetical protein
MTSLQAHPPPADFSAITICYAEWYFWCTGQDLPSDREGRHRGLVPHLPHLTQHGLCHVSYPTNLSKQTIFDCHVSRFLVT